MFLFKTFAKIRLCIKIKSLKKRAILGAHFTCGQDTTFYLEGAKPNQIIIGDYVDLMQAELRCYSSGNIQIGNCCWFSLRTQIISCSSVKIGSHCIFGRDVYISDSNEHPINIEDRKDQTIQYLKYGILPDRSKAKTASIEIGDDCWIGERVVVLKGVKIGRGSVVAAQSVVTKSIPDFSLVAGNPAQIIRTLQIDNQ